MIRNILLCCISLIGVIGIISPVTGNNKPVLVCYMYDITQNQFIDFDPNFCTHIVYYEVNISFSEVVMSNSTEQRYANVMKKFNEWKIQNPSLKTLISVHFDMEKKEEFESLIIDTNIYLPFSNNLITFLIKNDLDGFNLRYNYLKRVRSSNGNLKHFLEVLSSKMLENDKILTTNIASCKTVMNRNTMKRYKKFFRYIFIMCGDYDYDYVEAKKTGNSTDNVKFITAEDIFRHLSALNFDKSFLVLGIDLRAYIHVNYKNTSDYKYYHNRYDKVCNLWKKSTEAWVLSEDPTRYRLNQKFTNGSNVVDIFYDSPFKMESKIAYIKDFKGAGVIVWPLNSDDVSNICNDIVARNNQSYSFPFTRSLKYYMDLKFTESVTDSITIRSRYVTLDYNVTKGNTKTDKDQNKKSSGATGSIIGSISLATIILTFIINFETNHTIL